MATPTAPVSAAQAIGEYMQSPDDLVKVSAFRKKLEKEKASIDTRLKIGVKEQLQATRLGLKKLLSTRNNVQTLKDEMTAVQKECDEPSIRVPTFDQISRVSQRSLATLKTHDGTRSRWFIGTLNRLRKWSTICLAWHLSCKNSNKCSTKTDKTS